MSRRKYGFRELCIQELVGNSEEGYSCRSEFDIDKHEQKYVNYLEVIIDEGGKVHYAVPSHQEYLIKAACKKLGVDRETLFDMCPREYAFDVIDWLCIMTGSLSIWTNSCIAPQMNGKQEETLRELSERGLYKGTMPTGGEQ